MNLTNILRRRNGDRAPQPIPENIPKSNPDDWDDTSIDGSDADQPAVDGAAKQPEDSVTQLDIAKIVRLIAEALTNQNCRCWCEGNTFYAERVVQTAVGGHRARESFSATFSEAKQRSMPLICIR